MILDALLMFTGGSGGVGNNDKLTDSPTTGTQVSSNVLDLGSPGLPASASGGGARDIGAGRPLRLLVQVTTAFAGGTNLQVSISGAPDNGSGSPGSYTIMGYGPVVVLANLAVGARLFDNDVPLPAAAQVLPRFLRLDYVTSGTHTAGKIAGTIVLDRFDQVFGAAGVISGYPAGITVSN